MIRHRKVLLFALTLGLAACGDEVSKGGKSGDIIATNNQTTAPNGVANNGGGPDAGNNGEPNSGNGTDCAVNEVEEDGVCRPQDHLSIFVSAIRYEGTSAFETTTFNGCTNIAVGGPYEAPAADLEVGSCFLNSYETPPPQPEPSFERGPLDVGDVTLTIGGSAIPLELGDDHCFDVVDQVTESRDGQTATVAASGGSDISAFEESGQLPAMPRVDAQKLVDASGAVTFSPPASSTNGGYTVGLSGENATASYGVFCMFEAGESVTIPAEIIARLRQDQVEISSMTITEFTSFRLESTVADAHVRGTFSTTYGYIY